jgi:hypothetical protein
MKLKNYIKLWGSSMHKVILIIVILLTLPTFSGELTQLELTGTSGYLHKCTDETFSPVCLVEAFKKSGVDVVYINIRVDTSKLSGADYTPDEILEKLLFHHLIMFNRNAAGFFNSKDRFIDLGLTNGEQEKVVLLGEMKFYGRNYVAFYEFDESQNTKRFRMSSEYSSPLALHENSG